MDFHLRKGHTSNASGPLMQLQEYSSIEAIEFPRHVPSKALQGSTHLSTLYPYQKSLNLSPTLLQANTDAEKRVYIECIVRKNGSYMSYSRNSLKGGYIGKYIVEY